MKRDSQILADCIDVMIAFQNGEPVQWRRRSRTDWNTTTSDVSNLSFDWGDYEYRLPPVPREGYVFVSDLHSHPCDFRHQKGKNTCFLVREVIE